MKPIICTLFFSLSLLLMSCNGRDSYDVVVIGGGTSGIAAGIQSSRMGARTVIIEESPWLGGMLTSAGVSAVDGNYRLRSGIWGEFLDSLTAYYGGTEKLKSGWVSNVMFEPRVGNRIFRNLAAREELLTISYETTVSAIIRKDNRWFIDIKDKSGTRSIESRVVIDATELGDIAKACGVSYEIGMDSKTATGESIAPEEANSIIQDMTYVAILKDYGRDMTIERPEGYDSTLFSCSCENPLCVSPKESHRVWSDKMMMSYGKLPDGKIMINWPIEGNDIYLDIIEMSPSERDEALKAAKHRTLCFVYFIQKELGYNTYSIADDEFPTADGLPLIPYHRESRRIDGLVRFTLNHITNPYSQSEKLYRTCIAVGDYPVDHHHSRYDGWKELPYLYFYPVPSYGLPLGVMIPKGVEGLIVAEKSISVSNLVNGTTRLQPVVLQIGQAAGALAALSVREERSISETDVREVQDAILEAEGYLLPYLDYPTDHPRFKSLQRIGSTGIMKGKGKNVDWSNQTWFRADTVVLYSELSGLREVYPSAQVDDDNEPVTIAGALDLINSIARSEAIDVSMEKKEEALKKAFDNIPDNMNQLITRGEMAVLLDVILDPFHRKPVRIDGSFKQ